MDRFVQRFERLVYRVCLGMLGQPQDAEDVAQDVFVRTFRSLHQWDQERPLTPWLVTIASNRCRTALARNARAPKVLNFEREDVASRAVREDLAEELDLALTRLRVDYRRCFELFYRQELSVSEVAERLGVPEGTIKTWLHRARRELVEHLEQRGITPECTL